MSGERKITNKAADTITFGELGSLFRVLHVSRLVFGAGFEFSNYLNIYEAVLVIL